MTLWKKIKKFLPFIGIALFVYILVKLDILDVINQIRQADLFYLTIAIIFTFLMLVSQTFKWWFLARKQNIGVGFREAFKINFMSNFYGFVTPSKIGSVIRADYLRKYAKIGKGISNFVLDKVLDLSSLFFMAIILGFVFKDLLGLGSLNYLVVLFAVMIFLLIFFHKKERSRIILKVVYRKLVPKSMKASAKTTFHSFYEDLPQKRFLLLAFVFNLITWIMIYSITYFVGLSLGIDLSFIYFLAILPLATLVAQIPITISGLGTREITMIGLFSIFGIEAVKVFSMSLLAIFIVNIIPAIIALIFIFKEKNEIYELKVRR